MSVRMLFPCSTALPRICLTISFSCALFDADGELIANAPNVPAHLGSMQYAVAYQAERRRGQLKPGDVLLSNTPEAGGGHLPDITVSPASRSPQLQEY